MLKNGKGEPAMKWSIRGRMMLLSFAGVVAVLLAVGTVAFYGLYAAQSSMREQENSLSAYLTESMEGYAEKYAKERLREVAESKAMHLDRELYIVGEDVEFMADTFSRILKNKENYRPRTLPNTRDVPNLVSGQPYIHYSTELRDLSGDLWAESQLAGNFADCMESMSLSYAGYRTSIFAGSKNGYAICLDVIPADAGTNSIYPSDEAREEFVSHYDPRKRSWYAVGKNADKPVFTDVYRGADGHISVSCVMPYYDADGFAGVTGISYSVADIYRSIVSGAVGEKTINFVLDNEGNIVFSSETEGLLAAVTYEKDLRKMDEPSIAEAARRMLTDKSGVMSVVYEGNTYYLAFAPMKSTGWSYGTVIEASEVLNPMTEVGTAIGEKMGDFRNVMQQSFFASFLRAGLILIPILLLIFYGSGVMASRMSRPIRRLADGAKEISAGNFDKKLEIHTGDEVEHLALCFNDMTLALKEYMKNLANAAAEQEHTRTELEVAARIQEDMLPNIFPAFPERKEFSIYATMDAAMNVGGDFYDFYLLDEGHLVVTIADVSGKGVPAALFMAKSQSVLKNCVLREKNQDNLAAAVERANQQLCRNNDTAMFVTVFIGVLDIQNGHFTYVNGGHCPPLLGRHEHYDFLPMKKCCVLGVMDMPYEQQSIDFLPGDTLYLYTDGVSEAMDEQGMQFTERQIKEKLNHLPKLSIEDILGKMREFVQQHAGTAPQSDDITMLGLRYYGNAGKPQ